MNIPLKVFQDRDKWIERRKTAERMIKVYTDDWVEAQKSVILYEEMIERLENGRNNESIGKELYRRPKEK